MQTEAKAKVVIWEGRVAVLVLATVNHLGTTALELAQCFALSDVQVHPERLGQAVRAALDCYLGFLEHEDFERDYWGCSPEREAFGVSDKKLATIMNQFGQITIAHVEPGKLDITGWVTKRGAGVPMDQFLLPIDGTDSELGAVVIRELERSLAATSAARLAPKSKRGG